MASEFDIIEPTAAPRATAAILIAFAVFIGAVPVLSFIGGGESSPRESLMMTGCLVASAWLSIIGVAQLFEPLRAVAATLAAALSTVGIAIMVYFNWRWQVFGAFASLVLLATLVGVIVLTIRLIIRDTKLVRWLFSEDA